jgi:hypothetical protein
MSTKPKASEAETGTDTKTATASEAQPGTISPALAAAKAAADTAVADTFTVNADRLIVTSRSGSDVTGEKGDPIDPDGRYTVVVQGPVAGRWRIGRKFTAEPTSIPASELTEAQVTALRDDPALMVSVIAAPY